MNTDAVRRVMKWDSHNFYNVHNGNKTISGMWVPKDNCYMPDTAIWARILDQKINEPAVIDSILHEYNRALIHDYRAYISLYFLSEICRNYDVVSPPQRIMQLLSECGITDLCQLGELWRRIDQDSELTMEAKDSAKSDQLARMTTLNEQESLTVMLCLAKFQRQLSNYHPDWITKPHSAWYLTEFDTPIAYAPLHPLGRAIPPPEQ